MTPLLNQILVKPCAPPETTEGGIFIPENARERSCKVQILKVGRGTKENPMKIPASVIGYSIKGSGVEIIENGEQLFLMSQNDILAYEIN